MRSFLLSLLLCCGMSAPAQVATYGTDLEAYPYPFPVHTWHTTVQRQPVTLAYMDVPAPKPNGRAVLLLHGKNFPGAYWKGTIAALTAAGYRVIVPDALGFGKSSKPVVQYSFALLALLDKQLLDTLGISRVAVVGHSMGGMVAARFTLVYPQLVTRLVLEDPLGLEDWRAKGAPVQTVDTLYAGERKNTYESILKYHQTNYYPVWRPEYEEWVKVQASFLSSPDADRLALVSALTTDMILSQPVLYEFPRISCPALVVVGSEDKTKVVRNAPEAVMRRLGRYRELGKAAADLIPGARFAAYDGVGHIPHLQVPEQFQQQLLAFLSQ